MLQEGDWLRLIEELENGDCTPFLGAGACHGVLPSGDELSSYWANEYEYPFADHGDLPRIMQYATVRERNDSVFVKRKVSRQLKALGPPNFTDPAEPHAFLAQFPIPVFLTTNYDDFLVQALRNAGKNPKQAMCSWSDGLSHGQDLFDADPRLMPDPDNPLVYHLHGSLEDPKSMVLTENDYLEFLVKISNTHESSSLNKVLPGPVLSAVTDNALLFIGYSLQDWTFRVIFHGLRDSIAAIHQRQHISVQMMPPVNEPIAAAKKAGRDYLTRYLERWNITIYWGTAAEFCRELQKRLGSVS